MTIVPAKHPVQLRLVVEAHVERARVLSLSDALEAKKAREYALDQTLDEHAATWSAILGRIVEPHEAYRLGAPSFPGGAA